MIQAITSMNLLFCSYGVILRGFFFFFFWDTQYLLVTIPELKPNVLNAAFFLSSITVTVKP